MTSGDVVQVECGKWIYNVIFGGRVRCGEETEEKKRVMDKKVYG